MEFGFLIKKALGKMLMPLPISFILISIGLIYFFKHNRGKGMTFSFLGLAFIYAASSPLVSHFLLAPLEFSYPKLDLNVVKGNSEIRFIVVLGCRHSNDSKLPLVAKIDQCSLPRVIQAVQIWRKIPHTKIVFSGSAASNSKVKNNANVEPVLSDPAINEQLAGELGVPSESMIIIEGTKDTEEESIYIKGVVGDTQFIVVSSASHIPRVMKLFARKDMTPIPSPAEYLSSHGQFSWHLLIPNSRALAQTERAFYEYLGHLWVELKGALHQKSQRD